MAHVWLRLINIIQRLGNWGPMDYSKITPRLYCGAAINDRQDVNELIDAGVSHVINCRVEFDDGALLAQRPEITYLHNPTSDDGTVKSPEWFQRSIEFALDAITYPHKKVYVHCAAGVNRGPSTAYAIMLAEGFTPEDAERIIRAARPVVNLAYKKDAEDAVKVLGYV
jgi:dual specificity phosphatase 3